MLSPLDPLLCDESQCAALHAAAVLLKAGEFAAARDEYQRVLAADPSSRQAHAGMYYALAALGDRHHAAAHLGKALLLQTTVTLPYRGTGAPVPVLVLLSLNGGNVLIQRFLDDRVFQAHLLFAEFYEEGMALPAHELVINAIGDADVRSDALAVAQSILLATHAPVVNSPDRVMATSRCRNARRLGSIPGVVTPLCMQFPRAALAAGGRKEVLATCGFSFPLLVRAPGFHMGKHFLRVDAARELDDALSRIPGEEAILMQYLDGRSEDGNVRKYRVLCVDGRIYPAHLAISSRWKVHYFSADMDEHPEHRAEEAEFLGNMARVLGRGAMAALKRIETALGMDYAGIDFGINRKGEVLLFEANATMAVYRPESTSQWDYRRAAVERIYAAVHRLFLSRAGAQGRLSARRRESLVAC